MYGKTHTALAYTAPGSDLVYDEGSPAALSGLLARLLDANPHAVVLLAHVHRSDPLDDAMTAAFEQRGLRIRAAPRTGGDEHASDITIISVQRA